MTAPNRRNTFILLLGLCVHAEAGAQSLQTGPEFLRGGEYLTQINKTDETYDPNEIQRSFVWGYDEPKREGIVDVRITVKADGSVGDVQLLDGFYDAEFREQALAGIASSIFHAPMAGDAAVDWPAYDMRIILRGTFLPSVSAALAPDLERVAQMLTARNFADAEPLIKDLLATRAQTLFDYAVLQDQLASVYMGTERPHAALVALRNATSSSKAMTSPTRANTRLVPKEDKFPDEYLLPDLYVKALQKRFLVALALNQTGEALNLFAQIESRSEVPADSPLRAQVEAIRTKLASEEPIASQIKLVQGSWTFETSTRRVFGMTGLQGQVDYVDIACKDSRRKRMVFTNDSEFGLPASWQNCKLDFHGSDGSQFLLYEYLN